MSLYAFLLSIPVAIIFGIWQQNIWAACFCQLFMHHITFMALCLEKIKDHIKSHKP